MNLKNVSIGVGIAIVAILLLEFVFNPANWFSILLGIVVGAIVVIVLVARSRGEEPTEVAREVLAQVMQPDPGGDERPVHEKLLRANQRFRLEGEELTSLPTFEELVDELRIVVPLALERMPGAEGTFNLKTLATKELPAMVNEFLDLGPESRTDKEGGFLDLLQQLAAKVAKLRDFIEQGQLQEFETEAAFVSLKAGATV